MHWPYTAGAGTLPASKEAAELSLFPALPPATNSGHGRAEPVATCCPCRGAQVGGCRKGGLPSPTPGLSLLTTAVCSCWLAFVVAGPGCRGKDWNGSPMPHGPHQLPWLGYWVELGWAHERRGSPFTRPNPGFLTVATFSC